MKIKMSLKARTELNKILELSNEIDHFKSNAQICLVRYSKAITEEEKVRIKEEVQKWNNFVTNLSTQRDIAMKEWADKYGDKVQILS